METGAEHGLDQLFPFRAVQTHELLTGPDLTTERDKQ